MEETNEESLLAPEYPTGCQADEPVPRLLEPAPAQFRRYPNRIQSTPRRAAN